MAETITVRPRLYIEGKRKPEKEDEIARVARLKSLQNSIAKRPEAFLGALVELDDEIIGNTAGIHDDTVATRDARRTPEGQLTEYFQKRDELELRPDAETDAAMFEARVSSRERMEIYIGRVTTWNAQQAERQTHVQAG